MRIAKRAQKDQRSCVCEHEQAFEKRVSRTGARREQQSLQRGRERPLQCASLPAAGRRL